MEELRLNSPVVRSRRLAIGLVILLTLAAEPILFGMPRGERHETRHEIDQLEDQWREAILHRNIPAVDALLSDDFMAITANGMLQTKDETITSLRNGTVHFNSIELADRKVRFYGATALVTSRAEVSGTAPGGDFSGSYRYTHVYVKDEKGVWRIVSFEASRIREPQLRK
jgi:ketosteroid isomerase-like protein